MRTLPRVKALLSDAHFSVDGTLIQAWASMKSFRRKDGNDEPPAPGRNGERNYRKEKRSKKTHALTDDSLDVRRGKVRALRVAFGSEGGTVND